jgi:hypothetical protein
LGFIELYTRISYEFETNEVFLNFALPKTKWGIHIQIKEPLDVLRTNYFPTSKRKEGSKKQAGDNVKECALVSPSGLRTMINQFTPSRIFCLKQDTMDTQRSK